MMTDSYIANIKVKHYQSDDFLRGRRKSKPAANIKTGNTPSLKIYIYCKITGCQSVFELDMSGGCVILNQIKRIESEIQLNITTI